MNIANPLLRELACVFGGFPSFTTYNIGDKQIMIFFFGQTIESQLDLLRQHLPLFQRYFMQVRDLLKGRWFQGDEFSA
jgi:hypothetical protein